MSSVFCAVIKPSFLTVAFISVEREAKPDLGTWWVTRKPLPLDFVSFLTKLHQWEGKGFLVWFGFSFFLSFLPPIPSGRTNSQKQVRKIHDVPRANSLKYLRPSWQPLVLLAMHHLASNKMGLETTEMVKYGYLSYGEDGFLKLPDS